MRSAVSPKAATWPAARPGTDPARVKRPGQGRHPRRRYGGVKRCLATKRTRLAGPLRLHHRLPSGWRLGGKGASSRGANGRIEEHGLHIWLGSTRTLSRCSVNAMANSIGRQGSGSTDPDVGSGDDPGDNLGLAEQWDNDWLTWLGTFSRNKAQPGDPDSSAAR